LCPALLQHCLSTKGVSVGCEGMIRGDMSPPPKSSGSSAYAEAGVDIDAQEKGLARVKKLAAEQKCQRIQTTVSLGTTPSLMRSGG
jgi:hypothetical protein